MTKRFRQLLFDIHNMEMQEEYNILEKTLEDWQSHKDLEWYLFPQIDDILILGIKV